MILSGNLEAAQIAARQFGCAAGKAMRAALATESGSALAGKKLKPDEIADAHEMALLLTEGEEMAKVQDRAAQAAAASDRRHSLAVAREL